MNPGRCVHRRFIQLTFLITRVLHATEFTRNQKE